MGGLLRNGIVILVAWTMAACGAASVTPGPSGTAEVAPTEAPSGEGRVITGEEALELYGIAFTPTPGPPTASPQIWFPARAWVEPSILPYDPNETIDFLPMFSSTTLGERGLWLGDLSAGQEVILHGVTSEGSACLVEGMTEQGWSTKGWVACNRLRFTEAD